MEILRYQRPPLLTPSIAYFSSNSIGIEASMTSAGKLELRSTETG